MRTMIPATVFGFLAENIVTCINFDSVLALRRMCLSYGVSMRVTDPSVFVPGQADFGEYGGI